MLRACNIFRTFVPVTFKKNMETLFKRHDQYLMLTPMSIVRDVISDINWDSHLIAIVGARGVGKSTLIRQYIKKNYPAYDRSVLYCSLDAVYFTTHRISDLVQEFVMNGGKRLVLDEVHKYKDWSKEVKEIYDLYPELKVVISGSSLLEILNADADLSRRCVRYMMHGLSFREFLAFYKGLDIPKYTLEEVIHNPGPLCSMVNAVCRPVQCFKEYLLHGYYPFYMESEADYYTKIEQIVNFVIEVELPQLRKVDVSNIRKLKALVSIISSEVPYELDASKISRMVGIGRDTVVEYLVHLSDAGIFNLLYCDVRNIGKLSRPDKVYLENTNLLYALSYSDVNIGTLRETFAVSQLCIGHTVEYSKKHGDFCINGKQVFEVGGKDKNFTQIAGVQDSYVLADDIETPLGRKLPLWVVGFLY